MCFIHFFCQNMPMPPKVKFMNKYTETKTIYYVLYMCLMPKLVTRCTIYDVKSLENYIARSPATANVPPGRPKSVYTRVNKTHKHFIYMLQCPMNNLR